MLVLTMAPFLMDEIPTIRFHSLHGLADRDWHRHAFDFADAIGRLGRPKTTIMSALSSDYRFSKLEPDWLSPTGHSEVTDDCYVNNSRIGFVPESTSGNGRPAGPGRWCSTL
jgi:hypothetical protein